MTLLDLLKKLANTYASIINIFRLFVLKLNPKFYIINIFRLFVLKLNPKFYIMIYRLLFGYKY